MSENFIVEIISPDKSVLKSQAKEVTIPSYEGEMGVLKGHIPLITFLRPGLIKILGDNEKKIYVEEGTVEFAEDNLLILSSTAKLISELDKETLEDSILKAEKKINENDISDKERYLLFYKLDTLKNLKS